MRTLKALWISALVVAAAIATATFTPLPAAAAGATCTWNGSAGNWNDAAKWSCLAVPGVGDTAIINAGTVTLTTDVTVGGLTLSTGTLGGSGALTVTDRFNWTSGTLTSTVPGTAFVLAPGSVMTVAGSIDLNGRTFNSHAATLWTAGYPYMAYGAVFNNLADATFTIGTAASEYWNGDNTTTFNNAGAITHPNANSTAFNSAFNNSGSVSIPNGTVTLGDNGAHTGPFTVGSGAQLTFSSGAHTLNGGASLTGAGAIAFTGATVAISTTYNIPAGTSISGGSATFYPAATLVTLGNPVAITGGTLTLNSGEYPVLPRLSLSTGTLGGSDIVTVTDRFNWTSGTLTSTVPGTPFALLPGSVMTVAGSIDLNGRPVNSGGTTVWTAGYPYLQYGATFNNLAGGVFTAAVAAGEYWNGDSASSFNNLGDFNRSNAPALSWLLWFKNAGNVNLASSGLVLGGPYTQTAGVTSLFNSTFAKATGSIGIEGGQLRGTGTITGTVVNNGGIVAPGNSPGVLRLVGNYVQGPNGRLDVELGGLASGTQYDLFDVTGSASLNGTLNVILVNAFLPSIGNTFRVLNFGSRTGQFSNVAGKYPGFGVKFTPAYNADNVTLLTEATVADVGLGLSARPSPAYPNTPITFTLVVANTGPDPSVAAAVTSTLPTGLSGATWTCTASLGSCGTGSGSGAINASVTLSATGVATFTLTGLVTPAAGNSLTISTGALAAGDPQPANNFVQLLVAVLNRSLYLPTIIR